MKKPTKSKRSRQARSPRTSRRQRTSAAGSVLDLRREIREGLVAEIRSAVAKTAQQLVDHLMAVRRPAIRTFVGDSLTDLLSRADEFREDLGWYTQVRLLKRAFARTDYLVLRVYVT